MNEHARLINETQREEGEVFIHAPDRSTKDSGVFFTSSQTLLIQGQDLRHMNHITDHISEGTLI